MYHVFSRTILNKVSNYLCSYILDILLHYQGGRGRSGGRGRGGRRGRGGGGRDQGRTHFQGKKTKFDSDDEEDDGGKLIICHLLIQV